MAPSLWPEFTVDDPRQKKTKKISTTNQGKKTTKNQEKINNHQST